MAQSFFPAMKRFPCFKHSIQACECAIGTRHVICDLDLCFFPDGLQLSTERFDSSAGFLHLWESWQAGLREMRAFNLVGGRGIQSKARSSLYIWPLLHHFILIVQGALKRIHQLLRLFHDRQQDTRGLVLNYFSPQNSRFRLYVVPHTEQMLRATTQRLHASVRWQPFSGRETSPQLLIEARTARAACSTAD